MANQLLAPNPSIRVAKFGGGVMPDGAAMLRSIQLAKENQYRVVVVSAFKGVTDQLIQLSREGRYAPNLMRQVPTERTFYKIKNLHDTVYHDQDTEALHQRLYDVIHSQNYDSMLSRAYVESFGERASALIFSKLSGFQMLTPEQINLTASGSNTLSGLNLDGRAIGCQLTAQSLHTPVVIPGYYAIREDIPVYAGDPESVVLFGRGGSDYTAAYLARHLQAEEVHFWKDVSGFLTADPNLVGKDRAMPRAEMTFTEVKRLAALGSKVMQSPAAEILENTSVVGRIRNFANPDADGTRIATTKSPGANGFSIACKDQELLSIESADMDGRVGYLHDVLGFMRQAGISVEAMGSGGTNFSFTVKPDSGSQARDILQSAGFPTRLTSNVSIVAIVADDRSQRKIRQAFYHVLDQFELAEPVYSKGQNAEPEWVMDRSEARTLIPHLHERLLNHS